MTNSPDDTQTTQAPTPKEVPHLTQDAPKIGGQIKAAVEDFEVEEVPAYEACGEGPHFYLWVEKRDVDGRSLIKAVADYVGVDKSAVGTAGTKDRRAITRQWVSVPAQNLDEADHPEPATIKEGIEILEVSRHRNKIRTGHLTANKFRVRITDTDLVGDELRDAVDEVAQAIKDEGLPNYYGPQRFGNDGSTLRAGWQWAVEGEAPRGRFLRRMAASALQSEVFNRVLTRRLTEGTWKTVLDGDIFEKTDTGGRFWIDESEREETQQRLDDREIVVTGPMPGSKEGIVDGKAGELEQQVLEELGIDKEKHLKRFGRSGRGTRRPLVIYIDDITWELDGDDAVQMEFSLPSGSYATVLLREFMGQ